MRKIVSLTLLFLLINYPLTLPPKADPPTAGTFCFAQEADLEFNLDVNANTISLPKIFRPNIDLSGRGFNQIASWPQELADEKVLDAWQYDIGFTGIYRIQYNLWAIHQLAKEKEQQEALLINYEKIIKRISDSGGIVILDLFGTPAGLGKVLDKKSPPWDLKAFKELIKKQIKVLSCDKRYNIWYEVWSAPDLDDFFLGRQQEYLNLYRAVAEGIRELEVETKIHMPLGGPSVSWWFQSLDGNTVLTPEKSLIYELIKFCYHYHLPLDFVSWHGYSTSPVVQQEITKYKKNGVGLIRDWLGYFGFDRDMPLIVDEWNYDRGINIADERQKDSPISASYIPSRIKNMYKAGIDYQLYFSLEDFQNNPEGVVRNVGIFWFDSGVSEYKGGPKATYNVFKMLNSLGQEMFNSALSAKDDFVDVIATKTPDGIALLFYNYIDSEIVTSFLSKSITSLNDSQRKALLKLIKSNKIDEIMQKGLDIASFRLDKKTGELLKKAQELNAQAEKLKNTDRNLKIKIKNLKGSYLYQRYVVDSSSKGSNEFVPAEEKEVPSSELYEETLVLKPYSVQLVVLSKKLIEPAPESPVGQEKP